MDMDKLVSLKGTEFDKQFGWIDWRGSDAGIIDIFNSQLHDDYTIEYEDKEGGIIVRFRNNAYSIPLTQTGCDRYVMINSLAEIIGETHDIWLHKEAMDSDTHGILVLPKYDSNALTEKYASWVKNNLQPLEKGRDEFFGFKIPYIGHEDNAQNLEIEYRELVADQEEKCGDIHQLPMQAEGFIRKFNYKKYAILAFQVLVLITMAAALFLKSVNAGEEGVPVFEDYAIEYQVDREMAEYIDLGSHASAGWYRTKLREGLKEGINFSGHYSIVSWGCGVECVGFLIVDRDTGKVYGIEGENQHPISNRGLEFRVDSRLLIVDPQCGENDNPCVSLGRLNNPIRYYLMGESGLKPIHKIPCRQQSGKQVCGK